MRHRRVLAAVVLGAAAAACAPAATTPVQQARAIEREVWSPYCPGRLLVDCTTDQARQMRAEIEDRLRAGQEPSAVLAWIRRNHGDEALARPEPSGAGLAIWLVPAGFFVLGAAVLARQLRRWTRPAPGRVRPSPDA